MAEPYRIMLIDDFALLKETIRVVLDREPDLTVCGTTNGNGKTLVSVETQQPDLVIVNLALKTTSSLQLVRTLSTQFPKIPILTYSVHDFDTYHAERALLAGAAGYVGRTDTVAHLLEAVRRVLSGHAAVGQLVRDRLVSIAQGKESKDFDDPLRLLSDREIEVFRMISEGYGTRDIAEKLCVSNKTVETYRERIKTKLQLQSGSDLLRYAIAYMHGRPSRMLRPRITPWVQGLIHSSTQTHFVAQP